MSDVALVIDTRAPKAPVAVSLGGRLPTPAIEPEPVARPPRRRPVQAEAAVTPPVYDPPPPPAVARGVLDEITAALAQLVPALPGALPLDLIRLLALKLDGHQDCAQLIHPRPGSLTLLDVRERCVDLIDCLPWAERLAVVGLIASDVGGGA